MICISIAQESRRMALVDMHNAAAQCDLLEIQLDRFERAPDFKELLTNRPKPVILSCRREQDGGRWTGSEEERLTLLRQCIINKADYVEIEVDVADQIRKFPPAKRVISYTNMKETPSDIAEIYKEAATKSPDVIKLMTLARTPEEAWPLLQILSKPAVPTIVVGVGKPGVLLDVLGRKIGAPWVYAALEKGMEAYPGQPTARDLKEVYHCPSIAKSTPLVAVTGFTDREYALIAALNAGFVHLGVSPRCLPIGVGSMKLFKKIIDVIRLKGVVVDDAHQADMLAVTTESEPAAKHTQAADFIVNEDKTWHGYNTLWRAAGAAIETVLRDKRPGDKPLQDRIVMVVGANATARAVTLGVKQRGGLPVVASHDRDAAHKIAHDFACRYIPFEAVYSTNHDVVAICANETGTAPVGRGGKPGGAPGSGVGLRDGSLKPNYLKPSITVMDLTSMPQKSAFLIEAGKRGCDIVSPRLVLLEQAMLVLRLLTNQEVPREALQQVLAGLIPDD
jgi:3-dehydroquinate dehydratase/shikimate dehydrogenase